MQRAFKISKNSNFYERWVEYTNNMDHQKKIVKEFLLNNGIETKEYHLGGNGEVNRPFSEYKIDNINLYIVPTEKDLIEFDNKLCKPVENGLRKFKKNNKLLKEFQQTCIDNKVVINIDPPMPRDYFESLGHRGYRYTRFLKDENIYLMIDSDLLEKTDNPGGFEEIKLSEFYKIMESESVE